MENRKHFTQEKNNRKKSWEAASYFGCWLSPRGKQPERPSRVSVVVVVDDVVVVVFGFSIALIIMTSVVDWVSEVWGWGVLAGGGKMRGE